MVQPITILRNLRARLDAIRRMDIGPRDVVLEVGSGQNPNPRANVLCDRYVMDDTERNECPVTMDRPFVVGDVYSLPFADRTFDYVICAHVLEHVDDPAAAIAELTRVAPRGYVETPSRVNEMLRSYPFHRWTVRLEEGTMIFQEKDRAILDPELQAWFEGLGAQLPGFPDFYLRNLHELGNVVGLVWEGRLPHRVQRLEEADGRRPPWFIASAPPAADEEVRLARKALAGQAGPSWRARLGSRAARALRARSDPLANIDERLACPACRGPLTPAGNELELCCGECARCYPVLSTRKRRVPYLVPSAARAMAPASAGGAEDPA